MKDITTEEAIEILKNVIQKYKESYQFQNIINADIIALEKVLNELEKKDKIIDAMAEYISMSDNDEIICKATKCEDEGCKNCIKQYFEKEVKDERK